MLTGFKPADSQGKDLDDENVIGNELRDTVRAALNHRTGKALDEAGFLIRHGIDPERHYTRLFIESLARATNHDVFQVVTLALAYAMIRLVEGYGLWRGRHWAEWFAVVSAGLYLPFEFQHLARHGTWVTAGVICVNILLVVYMARLLIKQRAERHAATHQKRGDEV